MALARCTDDKGEYLKEILSRYCIMYLRCFLILGVTVSSDSKWVMIVVTNLKRKNKNQFLFQFLIDTQVRHITSYAALKANFVSYSGSPQTN